MKFFDQVQKLLETRLKDAREKQDQTIENQLPVNWCISEHDKTLLKFVSDKGLQLSDIGEWV